MAPEKTAFSYKRDCHELINQIWGLSHDDQSKAYAWLQKKFGYVVHFADINDLAVLRSMHAALLDHFLISRSLKLAKAAEEVVYQKSLRRNRFHLRGKKKLSPAARAARYRFPKGRH